MIQVHKFRERHLNIFIKNWLEKNNQTFYRLRLSFGRELNWEKVLEGIEHTAWDDKRRSRYFRLSLFEYKKPVIKDPKDKSGAKTKPAKHYKHPFDRLKTVTDLSGIRISCQAQRDFEQLKYFLNFNCSVIIWGEWITLDNLLNASGNRIMIQVHKFRERHLNIFIKNWLERNNQTFRLRLSFDRELNWEKVLEGIEHTAWDEKRRSRYFRQNTCYAYLSIDCKDGRDFERKDGKLATVFQNSKFFNMIVWHDRFH
ncbi:unnamed protein product [Caenorhabditis brenneri]